MVDTTCFDRHTRRLENLKTERTIYEPLWFDYDRYIVPDRYRINDRPKSLRNKYQAIVDETQLLAYRTFRSGMHSGNTSSARPWFRLSTYQPKMKEVGGVKSYLYEVENRKRLILQSSNIYNFLHNGYGDLGQFGQMVGLLVDDDDAVVRAIPCLTGQYWMSQNDKFRVDTLYRCLWMTVKQIVGRFVRDLDGNMNWDVVSNAVRGMWDKGNYEQWVKVWHAVEPREDRDTRKADKRNKKYCSNYWEDGGRTGVMLEESGFSTNRILAPRWETVAEDVYGSHHPGDVSLPAIKMLQAEQIDKGQAIKKKHNPPMVGPTSLKNAHSSTLPGSITYVDSIGQQSAYRSAFDVNLDISHLAEDIQQVQKRIERCWYTDLFMAISQMEGIQPKNVFELTQRKEEQLLQLGPVIERQQNELLGPIIDITYEAMGNMRLLPEPPRELEDGEPLKIEYISILAQAQRAVATGSIERYASFVGNLAGAKADVLDKLDFDQAADEYADMLGVPPSIVPSDDDVARVRAQRQQAQNAQANAEMAATVAPAVKQSAEAAKLLSETGVMSDRSNLTPTTDLLSRLGIAG